jgi:hypothetical protein
VSVGDRVRRTCSAASAIQREAAIEVAGPQKRAQPRRQLVAQLERLGVAVRQLPAIGAIDRPRRHADVVARRHVVPPEQIGGGESGIAAPSRLPNHFTVDQAVRFPPQPHFHEVAEQPTVGDDAVIARQRAGHERGLYRAGDGRRHSRKRTRRAGARERTDVRRVSTDVAGCEPGHEDRESWTHETQAVAADETAPVYAIDISQPQIEYPAAHGDAVAVKLHCRDDSGELPQ